VSPIFSRALSDSFQIFDTGFKAIGVTLLGAAITALIVFIVRGWERLKTHIVENVFIVFGGAIATWLLVFLFVVIRLPAKMLTEADANLTTVIEEKRQRSVSIDSLNAKLQAQDGELTRLRQEVKDLEQLESPKPPICYLSARVVPGFLPLFQEGKKTRFDIYLAPLTTTAQNLSWSGALFLRDGPESKTIEDEIWKEFVKVPFSSPGDLIPSKEAWSTFTTDTLTGDDVSKLKSGAKFLYVVVRAKYQDANGWHLMEYCASLQPPGDSPIWHVCTQHNRTR
jgi:hypothetical protein